MKKKEKRFNERAFHRCVYVQLRVRSAKDFVLIGDLLKFCIEKHIYSFGGSTTGAGGYYASHTEKDAVKIEKFVEDWIKEHP